MCLRHQPGWPKAPGALDSTPGVREDSRWGTITCTFCIFISYMGGACQILGYLGWKLHWHVCIKELLLVLKPSLRYPAPACLTQEPIRTLTLPNVPRLSSSQLILHLHTFPCTALQTQEKFHTKIQTSFFKSWFIAHVSHVTYSHLPLLFFACFQPPSLH